jgi:beta-N-acetylhexosaminidase
MVVALALGAWGCSDPDQSLIAGSPAAFLRSVIAAMNAQPRMVVKLTGGSIRRAVIDTNTHYFAIFSSQKLLLLQKGGVAYRYANGCYHASAADRLGSQSLWAGTVDDVTASHYSAKLSGTSVVYRSAQGEMAVDSHTRLIRSARAGGLPEGGVAATTATFSYPGSVQELPTPAPLCHAGSQPATGPPPSRPAITSQPPALVASLSPEQLAGQRVIYSYSGLRPPASLVARIRAGEAAGVIFFADNISSPAQIRGVTEELQRAAMRSPVKQPLLLMTDQEGGQVRRLPGAPEASEKDIGASADPAASARLAGRGAGNSLRAAGMDVNLAPVLDVFRSPGNFIDRYARSYSSDPRQVARLGSAFITAQQQTGVAATAKHFPGLGAAATAQDTDTGPVALNVGHHTLRAIDELPYRLAVRAGVRLVMVSWATYPALDPDRPAGLSPTVVQSELRGRLGFSGVTVTDALEAGALRAYGTTSNRAVLAAHAGMDLLLCAGQQVGEGDEAARALASALRTGRITRSAFSTSVDRIVSLRSSARG